MPCRRGKGERDRKDISRGGAEDAEKKGGKGKHTKHTARFLHDVRDAATPNQSTAHRWHFRSARKNQKNRYDRHRPPRLWAPAHRHARINSRPLTAPRRFASIDPHEHGSGGGAQKPKMHVQEQFLRAEKPFVHVVRRQNHVVREQNHVRRRQDHVHKSKMHVVRRPLHEQIPFPRMGQPPQEKSDSSKVSRRRWVFALIAILVLASWPATRWVRVQVRQANGEFVAEEYGWVRETMGQSRVAHMPAAVPAGAREVRIFAPGAAWAIMPMPDHMMEVRMLVSPSEAAQIAASAKARFGEPKADFGRLLRTVPQYPLPTSFVTYSAVLSSDGKPSEIGISVDAVTGEVVYWYFDI